MKLHREQPVDAQVLAFWRTRSALLSRMLGRASSAEQSWFWQIQSDIVNYMLRRYAGEDVSPPASAEPKSPTDVDEAPNPMLMEVRPSGSFTGAALMGKAPRVGGNIEPVLSSIARGNHDRYERLRRVREEQQERERLDLAQRVEARPRSGRAVPMSATSPDWVVADTPWVAILAIRSEMIDVSDDEIADILSGKITVDSVLDSAWDDEAVAPN